MASISVSGEFNQTKNFLKRLKARRYLKALEKYGEIGVDALAQATPRDTGKTASSWAYEIELTPEKATLTWTNSNVVKGYANIAILLDTGHGTGTGGYVRGLNYISPTIQPILDHIMESVRKEVTMIDE